MRIPDLQISGRGRAPLRAAPALVVIATLVVCLGAGAALAQDPELELRLRQAERRLQQGDTVGALLDVEAVLSRDDRLWEAYRLRGRIQSQMGDDLGARESFRRAVELDPGNAQLHYLVAGLAFRLADFPAVKPQLLAAAQAGYDPDALRRLAAALEDRTGIDVDLESALEAPRIAVEHDTGAVEEGIGTDSGLAGLALELRTLLLEADGVALVKPVESAAWVVRLAGSGPGPDDGPAGGRVTVVLGPADGGEPVGEWQLPGTGAAARVRLAEIVAELVERVGS